MLSMREFEIFWAITIAESFTKAGEMLGISQPAVSRYVRHAEDTLGYKLFVRKNGRVRPSPEAELLLPVVSSIFDGVESARRVARELRHDRSGSVKIAAESTLASDLITRAIGSFLKVRPHVSIGLKVLARSEVMARVLRRQVDLGLVYTPINESGLNVVDLYATRLVVVISRYHELATKDIIDAQDIIDERIISPSQTSWCGRRIEQAFLEHGLQFRNTVECSHSMLAYMLVHEGVGIAIVEPLHRSVCAHLNVVAKTFSPIIQIRAQLFFRCDHQLSHIANSFVDRLQLIAKTSSVRYDGYLGHGSRETALGLPTTR